MHICFKDFLFTGNAKIINANLKLLIKMPTQKAKFRFQKNQILK